MFDPLFSIIIPVYNCEKTIKNCLDSVISQKYTNYQVIIIDSLSSDNTLSIVNNYGDSRILIYSGKDQGIYDAMNRGIDIASGKWIYFLGSDDRFINNNVLMSVLVNIPETTEVIYGNVVSSRFGGRYDGEFTIEKILSKNICHQAIFLRRSLFAKIGEFDIKYKALADYEFNLRWFLNPRIKRKYIDIDIAEYADGGYSSTNYDSAFMADKNLKAIEYGLFYLPPKILYNLTNSEVNEALNQGKIGKAFRLKLINYYSRLCLKFRL